MFLKCSTELQNAFLLTEREPIDNIVFLRHGAPIVETSARLRAIFLSHK